MNSGLSADEIAQAAQLLSKLEPGYLPFEIFLQVARLSVMSVVEIVPLRLGPEGNVEVLLLQRPADDPLWPNKLHTPGTVLRPTDSEADYSDAFARVSEELGQTGHTEPIYLQQFRHHSLRGATNAQIFWVQITGEPKVGTFYPITALPEMLVQEQREFIPLAAEAFRKQQTAQV